MNQSWQSSWPITMDKVADQSEHTKQLMNQSRFLPHHRSLGLCLRSSHWDTFPVGSQVRKTQSHTRTCPRCTSSSSQRHQRSPPGTPPSCRWRWSHGSGTLSQGRGERQTAFIPDRKLVPVISNPKTSSDFGLAWQIRTIFYSLIKSRQQSR